MCVVVVVGIGRQPAPHGSEVVKTPYIPKDGRSSPQIQQSVPKTLRVGHLTMERMDGPCHSL